VEQLPAYGVWYVISLVCEKWGGGNLEQTQILGAWPLTVPVETPSSVNILNIMQVEIRVTPARRRKLTLPPTTDRRASTADQCNAARRRRRKWLGVSDYYLLRTKAIFLK